MLTTGHSEKLVLVNNLQMLIRSQTRELSSLQVMNEGNYSVRSTIVEQELRSSQIILDKSNILGKIKTVLQNTITQ